MKESIIRIQYLCLVLLLFTFKSFSQSPEVFLEKIKEKYPNENFIQLDKTVHYDIFIDKGELKIRSEEKEKFIYIKNVNNVPITLSTYSSSFRELVDYKAFSYIPDGKKYKKVEVVKYNEKMNVDSYAFYDDIKEQIFTFPGITEGTIIELNTVHSIKEPRLLSKVYLNTFVPIQNFSFSIDYDKNIDLEVIKYNVLNELVNVSHIENKKHNTYKLLAKNLERMEFEDQQPDLTYILPHLIPKINKYKYKDKEIDILSNVCSLYKWYQGFLEELNKNKKENDELKTFVNELIKSCNNELEKVESIYYWVQENIKYISFEDSLGGFIPRDPYLTYKNKYGDCKDKSAILHEMLKIAGIESFYTWVGTYDIPYTYNEVPTPLADNHMIITYINEDTYYFLDGTSEYLNISYPNTFIQGKEALIAKGKDEFEIKVVPVIEANRNKAEDVVTLEIIGKNIVGLGNCVFTGYYKSDIQARLFLKNPVEQKKYLENNLEKGNDKFVLGNYNVVGLNTFNSKIIIDYNFELNNYLNVVENNLFINLNFNRYWLDFKLKEDRKNPVFLEYNTYLDDKYVLEIPEGYTVDFLPKDFNNENDIYSYSINYELKENKIYYNQKVIVKTLFVDNTKFSEWNKFISGLEKAYKQTIILKKDEN